MVFLVVFFLEPLFDFLRIIDVEITNALALENLKRMQEIWVQNAITFEIKIKIKRCHIEYQFCLLIQNIQPFEIRKAFFLQNNFITQLCFYKQKHHFIVDFSISLIACFRHLRSKLPIIIFEVFQIDKLEFFVGAIVNLVSYLNSVHFVILGHKRCRVVPTNALFGNQILKSNQLYSGVLAISLPADSKHKDFEILKLFKVKD
jgi:hypothetical protein